MILPKHDVEIIFILDGSTTLEMGWVKKYFLYSSEIDDYYGLSDKVSYPRGRISVLVRHTGLGYD